MILLADNEGPDQTAQMRRLIWAFAVRIFPRQVFAWREPYYQNNSRWKTDLQKTDVSLISVTAKVARVSTFNSNEYSHVLTICNTVFNASIRTDMHGQTLLTPFRRRRMLHLIRVHNVTLTSGTFEDINWCKLTCQNFRISMVKIKGVLILRVFTVQKGCSVQQSNFL